MHGIRHIYAWVEVWVDGYCIDTFRVGQFNKTELQTLAAAKRRFCNVTRSDTCPILY